MKQGIGLFLACILLAGIFSGCRSENEKEEANTNEGRVVMSEREGSVIPNIDWEKQIRTETVMEETRIDQAMAQATEIQVEDVTETHVTITVSAPDIGADIIAWYDRIPDEEFSVSAMEDKVIELIQDSEPVETQLSLSYIYKLTDIVEIDYSSTYYDLIYCGIAEFYDYAMGDLYEEVLDRGKEDSDE